MSETATPSPRERPLTGPQSVDRTVTLQDLVGSIEQRVERYLDLRGDKVEQRDHLRHVANRTRWLYYTELQRSKPGASVLISSHEDALLDACVLGHDMGKWIPRDELKALIPDDLSETSPVFQKLRLTPNQIDLFALGVQRRFELETDGYTPEYDSAHHLVSAYILATDPALGIGQIDAADQERLINMIVGHQFGSYFKESLLHISLTDNAVTTGMLVDAARPDRVAGDLLASAFHDADISDLLFVGSLESRPNREDIFHTGGLVKILMINFANLITGAPGAPATLNDCLRSCQLTVTNVCEEFLTATAVQHGARWRKQARRFLSLFREKAVFEKLDAALTPTGESLPPAERLNTVRLLTHMQARAFLQGDDEEEEED